MHLTVSRHPRRGADGGGRREGSFRGRDAGRASCSLMRRSRRSSPSRIGIIAEIGKEKAVVPLVAHRRRRQGRCARVSLMTRCVWVFDTFDRHERQQPRGAGEGRDAGALRRTTFEGRESEISDALYYLNKEVMRKKILGAGHSSRRPQASPRCAPSGARWACCPAPHGSAVFTRGQTQAMTVATLAPISEVSGAGRPER